MKELSEVRFRKDETKLQRVHRVLDELVELEDAVLKGTNIAEESADVIVATYQMFYHLGYTPDKIRQVFDMVEAKNYSRGYYDVK